MIRPDTPPGTQVVCIDDSPGRYGPSCLTRGAYYTIQRIAPGVDGNYVALLEEVGEQTVWTIAGEAIFVGYLLSRFRYIDIPDALSRLQTANQMELN